MKKTFLHIVFVLGVSSMAFSQNLVPNPSFEEFPSILPLLCTCGPLSNPWGDTSSAELFLSPPWYSPSSGSPDCLKPCSQEPNYSVPTNAFGFQSPRTGIGYAFIACKTFPPEIGPNYREYLQIRLSEKLNFGENYYIEFYASCGDNLNYAVDRLGLYVSDTIIWLPQYDYHVLPFTPHISNPTFTYLTDTINWYIISGIYNAQGGEQYITIGNFYDDDNTHHQLVDSSLTGLMVAGYYIEDVSVIPIRDTVKDNNLVYIPNVFSPNNDGENDTFCLRGKNIEVLNLSVFDRWGNKVFGCADPEIGWNGRHNGASCEVGVYYYNAEIGFSDGEIVRKAGNITLIK